MKSRETIEGKTKSGSQEIDPRTIEMKSGSQAIDPRTIEMEICSTLQLSFGTFDELRNKMQSERWTTKNESDSSLAAGKAERDQAQFILAVGKEASQAVLPTSTTNSGTDGATSSSESESPRRKGCGCF